MVKRLLFLTSPAFVALTCLAQSTSSLPQQLGSPVIIDEVTVTRDSVVQRSRISNHSDRSIKAITLGCVSEPLGSDPQVAIGSPVVFNDSLPPSASRQLTTQSFPTCITKPHGHVILFVARARYDDNSEYIADVAAIKSELSRKSASTDTMTKSASTN